MSEIALLLGNKIRELRKSKNMSQEELAFKASISPAHLGQIERATKNPTLDTIKQIADALEVPLHSLFLFNIGYAKSVDESAIIKKINIQLSTMTEKQQKEILRLIRITKHFNSLN